MSDIKVIALVGLSGVGKSTLLNNLSQELRFLHLQASNLIKAETTELSIDLPSSEALRTGDISRNQELLVKGFQRAALGAEIPIVLDAHAIIDSGNGLIEIPSHVFKSMGVDVIVFLRDTAHAIAARRMKDTGRVRPKRTEEELDCQQTRSIEVSVGIARDLNIPISFITHDEIELLRKLIL